MTKFKPFFLLIFIFYIVHVHADYGKLSPNTQHFISLLKENKTEQLKKQYRVKEIKNTAYVNVFIFLNDNADVLSLTDLGVKFNSLFNNVVTAQVPVNNIEAVSKLSSVKYVQIGTKVMKRMDAARVAANVDDVQAGTDLAGPFTGKDVIVGIIDNGFQYDHINFYTADGTQTRIKRVWDQNATGTPPSGFSYGAEYTTQSAIFNAKNDFTDESHATHVTGIAAGSDKNNGNNYFGVAPDADIVMVSYNQNDNSSDNVSLADGIKYIYDYASSVGKPCVVNMSLGSHLGPHDGTSAFDQVCDQLQGNGRLLVGAAGNEGSDKLHIYKQFSAATDTLKSFLKFYSSTSLDGQADLWGDVDKDFQIKVVIYNKNTKAITFSTPFFNAATVNDQTYSVTAASNGITGKIYFYSERNVLNNKPNAFVYLDLSQINTYYNVGLIITATDGSSVHGWADDFYSYFSANSVSGWTDGNSTSSVGEIGGTGNKIISVGAYTSKKSFVNINGQTYPLGETLGKIASFSSKGPTPDNRVKPDITAPGTVLVSSFSSAVINNSDFSDYLVKKNVVNGVSYYYGAMQGTSMATPFVTGILATWLGANHDLNPDQVRTILQTTSISDTYTGTIPAGGSNTWGFGKIDAWNGIKKCISLASAVDNVSADKEIILYPNPCTDNFSALFTAYDSNVKVTIFAINGQQVMTKNLGTVEAAREEKFDINQLPKGVYMVSITGNNHYKTYKILKK